MILQFLLSSMIVVCISQPVSDSSLNYFRIKLYRHYFHVPRVVLQCVLSYYTHSLASTSVCLSLFLSLIFYVCEWRPAQHVVAPIISLLLAATATTESCLTGAAAFCLLFFFPLIICSFLFFFLCWQPSLQTAAAAAADASEITY